MVRLGLDGALVHRLCYRLPDEPADAPEPLTPAEWQCYAAGQADDPLTERAEQRAGLPPHRLWDDWCEAGVWSLTSIDPDYPAKLLDRLGPKAPPLLFGVGPAELLSAPGVAVAGSRDAAPPAIEAAHRLGEQCHRRGLTVISGAARGADQAALTGALAAGGSAVAVLACELLARTRRTEAADAVEAGRLVIISPFEPDAAFSAARAFARNRLIYSLGETAVVIAAEAGRGGTRAGALEALRGGWSRVIVRTGEGCGSGVDELLRAGAVPAGDHDLLFGPLLFGA